MKTEMPDYLNTDNVNLYCEVGESSENATWSHVGIRNRIKTISRILIQTLKANRPNGEFAGCGIKIIAFPLRHYRFVHQPRLFDCHVKYICELSERNLPVVERVCHLAVKDEQCWWNPTIKLPLKKEKKILVYKGEIKFWMQSLSKQDVKLNDREYREESPKWQVQKRITACLQITE